MIERDSKIQSPAEALTEIKVESDISFEDVKFKYPTPENAPYVFTGMSFKLKVGTSTAIVGPSGSGKSTIVQLLNRLYDPEEGTVRYGNDNVKSLDLVKLRDMIGYVGQEPVLIIGTIRENLQYGNADATD